MHSSKIFLSKGGFEPPTHGFSVHCSTPELFRQKILYFMQPTGFEPVTCSLEGCCSSH